jgi:hypothetical protein
MNSKGFDFLHNTEGKGFLGCLIALILFATMIFIGIKLGPIYYSNYLFEEDLKTATSRAGARVIKDENLTKDILDLAKNNNIRISRKDIKIQRFAGQIHVSVHYSVPVDFLIMQKTLEFEVKTSSFTVV